MFELKPLSREAIPEAFRKVERYRLLNEPDLAESICEDILRIEPDNQEALRQLLLSRTDQFGHGVTLQQARAALERIHDPYEHDYHAGLVYERWGRMLLRDLHPGTDFAAYEAFRHAMDLYEMAAARRPPNNDDSLLRWNTCVRTLAKHPELRPRPAESYVPVIED